MRWSACRRRPTRVLALMVAALCCLTQARSQAGLLLVDSLDCSFARSRTRHAVRIAGGSIRSDTTVVGRLKQPVAGVMLLPGGAFGAHVGAASEPTRHGLIAISLATSSAHLGRRQAYRVFVAGVEVYSAAETDPGAGVTRTCFVPADLRSGGVDLRVVADRDTAAPITVAMVRVYRPAPEAEGAALGSGERMGLALLTSLDYGYRIDDAEMKRIAALIPRGRRIVPQAAVLYNFCTSNPARNASEMSRLAGLARTAGLPLRIAFQMHWSGIPAGVPDGAGGKLTDLPYQQITFDPDEQADKPALAALMGDQYDRRFGLTVPNRWGDTPWLTMDHPRLNRFRRLRLKQAVGAWQAERDRLRAGGLQDLLPGELSTGEETVYWAKGVDDSGYTAFNGGRPRTQLLADFNPFTVAAALRDGVILDPRKGLGLPQRLWLHQNLARWQQTIVNWMREGLGPEAAGLSSGTPEYADDLVARNVYTEPYAMPLYPMKGIDALHPGLEVGYVVNGRSGGEYWSGATMLPWLIKERERGRIALPNLECTGADDGQLVACLRAAYAYGARFSTLYNWHHRPNTAALLSSFAASIARPAGLRYDAAPPSSGASAQASVTASRQYAAPADAFGANRIEVALSAQRPYTGLLRVTLRDLDGPRSPAVAVTVPVDVAAVSGAPAWQAVALPGMFHQVPGRRYEVLAEVVSPGAATLALAADGQLAVRVLVDIALERERSVALQDWQDATDLIEAVTKRHASYRPVAAVAAMVDEARKLMARGSVREAYRAAIRAEQASLPAAFDVPRNGARLAPYDIAVECPLGPVRAVVRDYTDRVARVTIRSERAQVVAVKRAGVRTTATVAPNVEVQLWVERSDGGSGSQTGEEPVRRRRVRVRRGETPG